jgi:hypothetical protein
MSDVEPDISRDADGEEPFLIQTSWERRLAERDRRLRHDLLTRGPAYQQLKMKIERFVIIAALVNLIFTLANDIGRFTG